MSYWAYDLRAHRNLLEEEQESLKWAEYRGATLSELRQRKQSITWRKAEISKLQALIDEYQALEIGA